MKTSQTSGLRITKAGALYVGVTLLLGFAAVNTGNNLLFLIVAALLAFMAVSGLCGWQNIKGLHAVMELSDELYAGRESFVTVRLENRKRYIPSFLLDLTINGGGSASFFMLPRLGNDSELLPLTISRRGLQAPIPAKLESPFPVNFFVRWTGVPVCSNCVVFPEPLPCDVSELKEILRLQGGVNPQRKGTDGDLARIFDYTGAEPLKMIHWRLSARSQDLKVKEQTGTVLVPILLNPDNLPGGMEERLSRAAWLVNLLIRDKQIPVGLQLGDNVITPGLSRRFQRVPLGTD